MNILKEPIHCTEIEKAIPLIEKSVLCANKEEGLGYYGIFEGFDEKTGKFIVKMTGGEKDGDWFGKKLKWEWIVLDTVSEKYKNII